VGNGKRNQPGEFFVTEILKETIPGSKVRLLNAGGESPEGVKKRRGKGEWPAKKEGKKLKKTPKQQCPNLNANFRWKTKKGKKKRKN